MPSRQTTLHSHLARKPAAGPSNSGRGTRRSRQSPSPDSEGSEGVENIKLSPVKPAKSNRARQKQKQSEYGAEDEAEEAVDDDPAPLAAPSRRQRHSGEGAPSKPYRMPYEPDCDLFSYPTELEEEEDFPERDMRAKRREQLGDRKMLEAARKQQEEDDDIGEMIVAFPSPSRSPPSPRNGSCRAKSPSVTIIDINPPKQDGRSSRGRSAHKSTARPAPASRQGSIRSLRPAAQSSAVAAGPSRSSSQRKRVPLVELRTLSQEERVKYKIWTPNRSHDPHAPRPIARFPTPPLSGPSYSTINAQPATGSQKVDEAPPPVTGVSDITISDADLDDIMTLAEETLVATSHPGAQVAGPSTARISPSKSPAVYMRALGKSKAVASETSDDDEPIIKKRKVKPVDSSRAQRAGRPIIISGKSADKSTKPADTKRAGPSKTRTIARETTMADTEDDGDMLEDIALDEPERFRSATRLRQKKKETVQQKLLRRQRNKRLGIVESTSESSSDEESANEGGSGSDGSSDSSDFIVEDGGEVADILPHQFSHNSAQTPEFKFKVVFHLLVLLVMKGSRIFPLRGENATYFRPQLLDLRRKLQDLKNSRVRSQIWHANFVQALEKFPIFSVEELEWAEPGCDACHLSGRRSRFRITLEGAPYDADTHEELDSSDESESSDSSEGSRPDKLPPAMLMGRFCRTRAEVFHDLAHWEDTLYHRIKGYYHDLLRAKYKPVPDDSEASSSESDSDSDPEDVAERRRARERRRFVTAGRVGRIRKKRMPENYKDVDEVMDWMDSTMGYQTKDFTWLDQLIRKAIDLEHDKRKDD